MSYEKTNWNNGDIITAEKLNNIESGVASSEKFVEITYSALKALRDSGELIEGTQYKITDYVCTSTDENTQVESHPFDIIVVADSNSVLNENARACMKANDNYYHVEGQSDAVLSAWELKYCIDNDTNRFAWADETNGKGVIFYMKDDRGNECSYDFKSIKFKRFEITAFSAASSLIGKYIAPSAVRESGMTVNDQNPVYLFTFSYVDEDNDNAILDNSIKVDSGVFGNVLNKRYDYADPVEETGFVIALNDNVFVGDGCQFNTFGDWCHSNTFGNGCNSNTFGNGCYFNTFGDGYNSNTFGDGCYSNTFGDECYSNIFGNGCNSNTFGYMYNLNTFGEECYSNTFGNGCSSNTVGSGCNSNTFGNGCSSNTVGSGCYSNTFGNGYYSNTLGSGCSCNTFGIGCNSNTLGDRCESNTLGDRCEYNTFGEECYSNTFGNGCQYVDISTQNTRYYRVLNGVTGLYQSHLALTTTANNNYETYVGNNSSGVLKYYCPMDSAT